MTAGPARGIRIHIKNDIFCILTLYTSAIVLYFLIEHSGLLVEDDIAKVILSVPDENKKRLVTYIHRCHRCQEAQV